MTSKGIPVKNGHAVVREQLSLVNSNRMQDFDDDSGDLSPTTKQQRYSAVHDDRVKRRALRPSERAAALAIDVMGLGSPPNGFIEAIGNAGRIKVLVNGNKFAKNSRRPRGRYGRGLPKKGTFIMTPFCSTGSELLFPFFLTHSGLNTCLLVVPECCHSLPVQDVAW